MCYPATKGNTGVPPVLASGHPDRCKSLVGGTPATRHSRDVHVPLHEKAVAPIELLRGSASRQFRHWFVEMPVGVVTRPSKLCLFSTSHRISRLGRPSYRFFGFHRRSLIILPKRGFQKNQGAEPGWSGTTMHTRKKRLRGAVSNPIGVETVRLIWSVPSCIWVTLAGRLLMRHKPRSSLSWTI